MLTHCPHPKASITSRTRVLQYFHSLLVPSNLPNPARVAEPPSGSRFLKIWLCHVEIHAPREIAISRPTSMLVINEVVLAAAGPTGRYYRINTEYWAAANIGPGPTTPTNIPSGPHTNIPAVQNFVLLRYSHTSSLLPKKM